MIYESILCDYHSCKISASERGAAFIALSMIVAKLVIPHKKPGALAMISSSIALAVGIGPLVGGAITNTLGAIFIFIYGYFSSGDFLAYKIYARRNAAYG